MGENGNEGRVNDRMTTERVILKSERVLVISDDANDEQIQAAIEALTVKRTKPPVVIAWVEVGRNTAPSKRAAIVAHAGEPGTPDAKVGEFRAPSVTAWKGGLSLKAPPRPLVTAEAID